jgi:hypothetical protein
MTELDMTDCRLKGDELKLEIVNRVKSTQAYIIRPYPDRLIITKDQYQMLQSDPEMQHTWDSKDHLYRTPHNVMELVIKL